MGKVCFGGRKEDATESFSYIHCRCLILSEKQAFGSQTVWIMSLDEVGDLGVDEFEAVGHGDLWSFDEPICYGGELGTMLMDDAVADTSDSRIDTEDGHRLNLRRMSPLGHVIVIGRPWGQR